MSSYCLSLCSEVAIQGILSGPQPDDELVELTQFPWIRLCKEDFEPEFRNPKPGSLVYEFNTKVLAATVNSHGTVVNSFYELEAVFVDYMNSKSSPKGWCVGPLCLVEQPPKIYPETGMLPYTSTPKFVTYTYRIRIFVFDINIFILYFSGWVITII